MKKTSIVATLLALSVLSSCSFVNKDTTDTKTNSGAVEQTNSGSTNEENLKSNTGADATLWEAKNVPSTQSWTISEEDKKKVSKLRNEENSEKMLTLIEEHKQNKHENNSSCGCPMCCAKNNITSDVIWDILKDEWREEEFKIPSSGITTTKVEDIDLQKIQWEEATSLISKTIEKLKKEL